MLRNYKKSEQKALEINLNESLYGTFAEIGAGQEVARNFFQVGAAAGTIAKTMSAYDKIYSDEIYGKENTGRYVCESRVYTMLDHEYELMEARLQNHRPNTNFFVFADTVAAINFTKTITGNGWLGVRFQLSPNSKPNDLVIHAKMLDNNNKLQQEAIGLLGVNMIYACYYHYKQPEIFVQSLLEGIKGRVEIDLIRLTGPDFENLDNRLLSLFAVKHGLTDVAMFNAEKRNIHASEYLYKKSLMVVRGNFRPPTLVTVDVFRSGIEQFKEETDIDDKNAILLTEMTLDHLIDSYGVIDEKDFQDRADLLSELGQTVIISNCSNHQRLINYLSEYKINKLGLVIGVMELLEIINEKYYQNQDGRLLVAFGELFTRNIKIYVYPALQDNESKKLLTAKNLPVPQGIKFLYKHLLDSSQVVEVENYNPDLLHIFPHEVLEMIKNGKDGWQNMVPSRLAEIIMKEEMLGYPKNRIQVEL